LFALVNRAAAAVALNGSIAAAGVSSVESSAMTASDLYFL
jgi:hypothetical protein